MTEGAANINISSRILPVPYAAVGRSKHPGPATAGMKLPQDPAPLAVPERKRPAQPACGSAESAGGTAEVGRGTAQSAAALFKGL